MAIYDNFPYTNIHELNLGWIIEQVKQGNLTIEDFAEQLQQFAEDYDTLSALATAFTIAGSNITTTKNFSAASLSGPLTGNVTGNLTGNVTGDVTGNVTGNVTGDVTGNADTATYATSAGSATNATNATNATYATTAGSATTATSATSATNATNADLAASLVMRTDIATADADDYIDLTQPISLFKTALLTSHVPSAALQSEMAIILDITGGTNTVLQLAWFWVADQSIYYRIKYSGAWQAWNKLTVQNP